MHSSTKISAFLLCVGLLLAAATQAQTPQYRVTDTNHHAWYMYFGDHKLTDHWGLHTEAQFRRASLLSKPQQLLLRGGVNYTLASGPMLTAGYCFVKTYPYGDYPAKTASIEHRVYEQLQLAQPLGRITLLHRYRLEQRWVHPVGNNPALYFNRARYLLKATLPLMGATLEPRELFLAAYDEVFLGFGRNVNRNLFDQNRAYLALGYKISPQASLEAGYLNQRVQQRNPLPTGESVLENNHTLQLGLTYNVDFRRKTVPAEPAPVAP